MYCLIEECFAVQGHIWLWLCQIFIIPQENLKVLPHMAGSVLVQEQMVVRSKELILT